METEAASAKAGATETVAAKAGATGARATAANAGATKAVAATDGATKAKDELLDDLPSEAEASKSVSTCIADKVWSLDAQPANSTCFHTQVTAVRGATQSWQKSIIKVKHV
jgi:hypothetical protein